MAFILLVPKGPLVLLVKSVILMRGGSRAPRTLFFIPNRLMELSRSSCPFSLRMWDYLKSGRLDNVISTDDAYGIVSIVVNWSFA